MKSPFPSPLLKLRAYGNSGHWLWNIRHTCKSRVAPGEVPHFLNLVLLLFFKLDWLLVLEMRMLCASTDDDIIFKFKLIVYSPQRLDRWRMLIHHLEVRLSSLQIFVYVVIVIWMNMLGILPYTNLTVWATCGKHGRTPLLVYFRNSIYWGIPIEVGSSILNSKWSSASNLPIFEFPHFDYTILASWVHHPFLNISFKSIDIISMSRHNSRLILKRLVSSVVPASQILISRTTYHNIFFHHCDRCHCVKMRRFKRRLSFKGLQVYRIDLMISAAHVQVLLTKWETEYVKSLFFLFNRAKQDNK